MKAIEFLYESLGYRFKNPELLESALSHRSFCGNKNNERLEYLGDAAINFIIAEVLFRQDKDAREGELSRLRATLVCGGMLSRLAKEFNLGQYLRLGVGELKSGGAQRDSILADGLEALVGAIYLDGGFETCKACVLRWYEKYLVKLEMQPDLRDPKTRLQEYLQSKKLPLPIYTVVTLSGPPHKQLFEVECQLRGGTYKAVGVGSSRRRAEQKAADKILLELKNRDVSAS